MWLMQKKEAIRFVKGMFRQSFSEESGGAASLKEKKKNSVLEALWCSAISHYASLL